MPINLVSKLGEGTSASVFKYDIGNKQTAVKLIKNQFSRRKTILIATKLKKLQHENIVNFLGYSVRPTALFFELCATYVEGIEVNNLSQMIGVLNEGEIFLFQQRMDFLLQMSKGIEYLHEHSIVHRDIKLSNILVTGHQYNVTLKVSDFDDFADIKATVTCNMTKPNNQGMTLAYTSPELCNCEVECPNQKSDMYALAITTFELFSSFSSAWHGVIPLLKDILLLNAIKSGKRPNLSHITSLYTENTINVVKVTNLIETTWRENPTARPTISEVIRKKALISLSV